MWVVARLCDDGPVLAPASVPGQQPSRVGPYQIARRLGAGGMGAVYLGHHHATGEPAAVKVIRPEYAADAEYRARLRREVAAASRVPRFCTAPVLAADVDAAQPWVAMEYIDGTTLDTALLAQPRLVGTQLEALAVGVAVALRAIHQHGIIHRDLKPSNILLSPLGPRVIDFGIARLDAADTRLTSTGAVVGTPAYMTPEQLRGEPLTTAVDVFAWAGLVTYAATGAPPFGTGEPALPGILYAQPALGDLAEPLRGLVGTAFAKHPAARPSAAELVDRLSRAAPAATAEVLATADRPPEVGQAAPRRRRRWAVGLAAAAAVIAVVVTSAAAATAGWFGSPDPPPDAAAVPFGSPVGDPLAHPDQVTSVAAGELAGAPIVVAGGGATVRVWDLATRKPIHELGSGSTVWSVATGEAAGVPVAVAGGYDGTARVWDLESGRQIEELAGHTDIVSSVALGALDGTPVAATASEDGTARVWSLETGEQIADLAGHTGAVSSVALGALDGTPIAVTGGEDETFRVWSLESGEQIADLAGLTGAVSSVAVGALDGTPIAVAAEGRSRAVRVWDLEAGQPAGEPLGSHGSTVSSVALAELADATIAVSGGHDYQLRVWDLEAGRQLGGVLTGHTGVVNAVAIGELDGVPVAVSGSADETVRVWSLDRV
jgi:WD40 repeat protein/predicted Ser/Thr protein kinase